MFAMKLLWRDLPPQLIVALPPILACDFRRALQGDVDAYRVPRPVFFSLMLVLRRHEMRDRSIALTEWRNRSVFDGKASIFTFVNQFPFHVLPARIVFHKFEKTSLGFSGVENVRIATNYFRLVIA